MKIQVFSDLHIEFENFKVNTANSDVIVLAGDIHVGNKGVLWALKNIPDKPVIYVLGNHEFYGKAYPRLVNSLKELTQNTNVVILENDVFTFDGVNFMGCTLWTDFELYGDARLAGYECQQIMSDYRKIRLSPEYSKLRSKDVAGIHSQSLHWLKKQLASHKDETNIIVTHHGPSTLSLPETKSENIIHSAYVSRLDKILTDYNPAAWLHGHLHNSSDYMIGECRVVCNPRGYPGERNPRFIEDLTIDVPVLEDYLETVKIQQT